MNTMHVYRLAGIGKRDPLALYNGPYRKADQDAIKQGTWDYDDPNFLCNQVFIAVERLNRGKLTKEERIWFRELQWFWHHHAISCAIMKKDKKRAQKEATIALQLQSADHPNKITRLLYLLVHDRIEEAECFVSTIAHSIIDGVDVERETAQDLLREYKSEEWPFAKPV